MEINKIGGAVVVSKVPWKGKALMVPPYGVLVGSDGADSLCVQTWPLVELAYACVSPRAILADMAKWMRSHAFDIEVEQLLAVLDA